MTSEAHVSEHTEHTEPHPFDADTRVDPTDTAGRFRAVFSPRWKALGGVINGGYSAAVCLSALRELVPQPDPLVVSTFFLRRGKPGPIEVHAEVAKRGRRVSTGQARVVADGAEIVRTTASFADLSRAAEDRPTGPTGLCGASGGMPDLPAPEDCVDPLAAAPMPEVTMTQQVEFRYPGMPGWITGRPSNRPYAEFWIGFTGGRRPDTWSLPLLVDGAAPVILELGAAGSATLELTTHVRRRPAPGWLACRVTTRHVADGYHEEDFELWDSQGRLAAQARQLAVLVPPPAASPWEVPPCRGLTAVSCQQGVVGTSHGIDSRRA